MGAMWYFGKAGQQYGPLELEQLRQMASAGALLAGDLVWTAGMAQWEAAGKIPELRDAIASRPVAQATAVALPYASGAPLPLNYVESVVYAGFWRRFVAVIVDGILLFIIGAIVGVALGALAGLSGLIRDQSSLEAFRLFAQLVGLVVEWLYFALQESGSKQATAGKSLMGLQVTDLQGQRISFARASGRFFGKIISTLIFFFGYIMAGFTERKQALHDIMAGCLVLKTGKVRIT